MKALAPKKTKALLVKTLRKMSAGWIMDEKEAICSILLHPSQQDRLDTLQYGIIKGWLWSKVQDGYQAFYFTQQGLQDIRDLIAKTTCITGRRVK